MNEFKHEFKARLQHPSEKTGRQSSMAVQQDHSWQHFSDNRPPRCCSRLAQWQASSRETQTLVRDHWQDSGIRGGVSVTEGGARGYRLRRSSGSVPTLLLGGLVRPGGWPAAFKLAATQTHSACSTAAAAGGATACLQL